MAVLIQNNVIQYLRAYKTLVWVINMLCCTYIKGPILNCAHESLTQFTHMYHYFDLLCWLWFFIILKITLIQINLYWIPYLGIGCVRAKKLQKTEVLLQYPFIHHCLGCSHCQQWSFPYRGYPVHNPIYRLSVKKYFTFMTLTLQVHI